MQHRAFEAFLDDEYTFVVFNDATNQQLADQIKNACDTLHITCIRVPQEIHTRPYLPRAPRDNLQLASHRHANCIQYSLDTIGFDHNGPVLILDSDMFLIRPFSITQYMENRDIAAVIKRVPNDVYYLCPVLCFLSMDKLPNKRELNFNAGVINEFLCDSGGWTYHYLIKHPELIIDHINGCFSYQLFLADKHMRRKADSLETTPIATRKAFYTNLGFKEPEIAFLLKGPDSFEFYLDHNFIHYRDGSNYGKQSQEYHQTKMLLVNELINDAIKG